ncbi:MAG TPA: 4-alpha-glucanotransferase [Labilithrix sp.]
MIRDALAALGTERLVLAIHDVSFPSAPDEETGHGSPYGRLAADFFAWTAELGFDGVQLGPQGQTTPANASPYDGSVFSKNALILPLASLVEHGLMTRAQADALVSDTPPGELRAHRDHAFRVMRAALEAANANASRVAGQVDAWAPSWLEHDARFEALATLHGTDDFRRWSSSPAIPRSEAWRVVQWLLDREHHALRARLAPLGLRLYGDLQIGLSLRDRWERGDLFFAGYAMGAPPSRTNPEGQPWSYAVLDPRRPLRVLDFARARFEKVFADYDGVRIDHPHGLVCPWVYDDRASEPFAAVQQGARLFESPAPFDPFGGALADVAIARADQVDANVPAYADARVRDLDAQQVDRYAVLFDMLLDTARAAGRSTKDVIAEVLSTCPNPLFAVLARHGLGRMRVTQKASATDPNDVYRLERSKPNDWAMLGNHDTDPIRRVVLRWTREGAVEPRAAYLARRLEPDASRRDAFVRSLVASPSALVTALVADLFVGPVANVMIAWFDLFGEEETYNTPGVVRSENWTMRVPRAFREEHASRVARGEAIDLRASLALALHARGLAPELAAALRGA